jgi:hypothetical protein
MYRELMKLSIILSTLLSTFATTVPNLCDEVHLDPTGQPVTDGVGQTFSKYCKWTGPDAPLWRADVCCTIDSDGAAACSKPDARAGCPTGTKRWFCEHGAVDALGGVTCLQPLPSGCEAGMCVEPPADPPLKAEFAMCCTPGGACQYVNSSNVDDCHYEVLSCDWGSIDDQGVVDCWG